VGGVQVSSRQLPCAASSLAWHPQNNVLLVGGVNGGLGCWAGAVPESADLPSPWKPLDEILKEADKAAAAATAGTEQQHVHSGMMVPLQEQRSTFLFRKRHQQYCCR
jgi:hypothetical protein